MEELNVIIRNQEHGIVAMSPNAAGKAPELPIGSRLRILPNHTCATAAQFDRDYVLGQGEEEVTSEWPQFTGW